MVEMSKCIHIFHLCETSGRELISDICKKMVISDIGKVTTMIRSDVGIRLYLKQKTNIYHNNVYNLRNVVRYVK